MSLTTTLATVARNVPNEVLGDLIKALDANVVGAVVRPLLDASVPATGVEDSMKSDSVPDSPVARAALTETIYESFGTHRRRSATALARITGLTSDAVLELVSGNEDFRVSQGQTSGNTYVSLRGL